MAITDIFHVNINCTNIEHSVQFYRDQLGLSAVTFEVPPELKQKNDEIARELSDLPPGDVEAAIYFLRCKDRESGTAIELSESRKPKALGVPYGPVNHVGISRVLCMVDDLDAIYELLVSRGIRFLSSPKTLQYGETKVRLAFCRDPDGTLLQLCQSPYPKEKRATPAVLSMPCVFINCTDLDRSSAFYRDTLGLNLTVRKYIPQSEALSEAMGLDAEFSAEACNLQTKAGPNGMSIDLVEWKHPKACGTPYEKLWHVGIPRLAFLTEDLDKLYEHCLSMGVRFMSKPRTLASEHGKTRAVHFYDPDGTVLELLELNYTGKKI